MSVAVTLKGIAELTEFFGATLDKVDRRNLLLATHLEGRPSWLKGKTKIEQLPRYTKKTLPYVYKYRHFLRQSEVAERLFWIVESLKLGWSIKDDGIYFESKSEFMYFVYRWGPPQ